MGFPSVAGGGRGLRGGSGGTLRAHARVGTRPARCHLASDNSAILERIADQLSPEQVEMAREQLESLPLPVWLIALAEVIPGALLNVPAALGEELGWRGLMHAELEPLDQGVPAC